MRKILYCVLIGLMVVLMAGCTSQIKNFYEQETPDGYMRVITPDQKASFLVPENLVKDVQEITQFNDGCNYTTTYLVKNDATYTISNAGYLYSVVKNTGSIPVERVDYENMFAKMGMRISLSGAEGKQYQTQGVTKMIFEDIPCMATLSSEYYNDYVGAIGIVQSATACYGIFFGVSDQGSSSGSVEKAKDIIIRSLILDESSDVVEENDGTMISGGVRCEYRNTSGGKAVTYAALRRVLSGDLAKVEILKNLPYSSMDSMPALDTGKEWIFCELETGDATDGMLAIRYRTKGSESEEGDVLLLSCNDTKIRLFFQMTKGVRFDLIAGEHSLTESVILGEVPPSEAETDTQIISLEDIQQDVLSYTDQFETEDETLEDVETESEALTDAQHDAEHSSVMGTRDEQGDDLQSQEGGA